MLLRVVCFDLMAEEIVIVKTTDTKFVEPNAKYCGSAVAIGKWLIMVRNEQKKPEPTKYTLLPL